MLKYLSLDEYTTVTWPCLSDHSTLAFPLNFTSRESTSQSLATSSVTWPDTLSPLVNVSLSLIGLYVTLRLLTVPGMLLLIRGKLSRKQDLEWLSQRGGRRPAYHQTGPHPLSASGLREKRVYPIYLKLHQRFPHPSSRRDARKPREERGHVFWEEWDAAWTAALFCSFIHSLGEACYLLRVHAAHVSPLRPVPLSELSKVNHVTFSGGV